MKLKTLVFCAVLAASALSYAAPAKLYIFSGQSNMQGLGKLKELRKEQKKSYSNVHYWNGKEFVKLILGVTRTSVRKDEFGPEIGFVHALAQKNSDQPIYIIKHYASGQPLHWGWNRNKWEGEKPSPNRGNFYPGKNDGDPNMGKHYKRLKTIFTNAMADLKKKGVSYNIKGILWMQGEQDSKHEKSATEYAQCLKRFYEQLQIDLDAKGVPFVFGQVLPHEPAAARFTHRKELRQSQANAVHDSGHKDAIPNVWMVPTEGMPLKKDTVHYNTEGQLMLGTAYAETMARAQNKKK